MYCDVTICVDVSYHGIVVSYGIVDKQCVWQQDRSPEDGDGPHCGWVQWWTSKLQCVYEWLLVVPGEYQRAG